MRIPVIANGDILTEEDAAEALRRSGADGVMIGRGCYGRPWFPAQVGAFPAHRRSRLPEPSLARAEARSCWRTTPRCSASSAPTPGVRLARKHVVLVFARPARLGRVSRHGEPAGRCRRGDRALIDDSTTR